MTAPASPGVCWSVIVGAAGVPGGPTDWNGDEVRLSPMSKSFSAATVKAYCVLLSRPVIVMLGLLVLFGDPPG